MKTKFLLFLFFSVIFSANVMAQTIGITCSAPVPGDCSGRPGSTIHVYIANITSFTSCNNGNLCKFTWEVTNGTIISGNGSNAINVKWNNVNGNGTVKVTSGVPTSPTDQGCPSCPTLTTTKTIPIKYLGNPGAIKINGVAYTGSYQLSCGTSPITVSVDPATNATNYAWSKPSSWGLTGSGNTVTITPSAGSAGTISVAASRSDVSGLTTTSSLAITRPLPSITGVSVNDFTFCSPSQTLSASATGVNADKYVWTPTSGVFINGSGSAQTVAGNVNISANATGSYTVRAYSTACAATSTDSYVKKAYYGPPPVPTGTVNGGPQQTPNVVPNGAYLVLNAAVGQYTYNWTILQGTGYLYPGASNSANATPNPFIRVEGKINNACGSNLTIFYLSSTPMGGFAIAPNPVTGDEAKVIFEENSAAAALAKDIKIYDEKNNKLREYDMTTNTNIQKLKLNEVTLDLKGFKPGQYFIHTTIGDKIEKQMFIIK